jgi:excisionase family DNA binding protein
MPAAAAAAPQMRGNDRRIMITQRETDMSHATGQVTTKTLLLVVDASPVVMAIWSLSAIWDIPTAPEKHQARTSRTQDRCTGPGGEAVYMSARTPEAEPLLTPAEVATMFRVDPKTVTRWAKAGKLTSIRTLGGHRRYRETEVRALLAGIPQPRTE